MILPGTSVPAPPRPAMVTVAFALQLGLAGLLTILAGVVVAESIHYAGLIDEAARLAGPGGGADASYERSANVTGGVLGAFLPLLFAAWFGVNAFWIRRGSNAARILTLVGLGAPLGLGVVLCALGGLGMIFMGVLLTGAPEDVGEFTGEEDFGVYEDSPFYEHLYRLDEGGWSAAYAMLGEMAFVTAVLAGIAVAVLLLTGTANRYFRPRPPYAYHPYPYYPPPPPYWYGPPR